MTAEQHDERRGTIRQVNDEPARAGMEERTSALLRLRAKTTISEIGCVLWTGGVGSRGHGLFWFDGRMVQAHRFVFATVVAPIPDGAMVLHRCDVPPCVNVDHLYLGDHARNMADRNERGRQAHLRGEANGCARLTDAEAREIARRRSAGELLVPLAEEFAVSIATVSRIGRGERFLGVHA